MVCRDQQSSGFRVKFPCEYPASQRGPRNRGSYIGRFRGFQRSIPAWGIRRQPTSSWLSARLSEALIRRRLRSLKHLSITAGSRTKKSGESIALFDNSCFREESSFLNSKPGRDDSQLRLPHDLDISNEDDVAQFPKLKTGAIAQYPTTKEYRFATATQRFVDGTEQRYRDVRGSRQRWIVNLSRLDAGEIAELQEFFRIEQGHFGEFDVEDPWTQMVISKCHFEQDALSRIFNLMYELQTIQRPSASLLIGARAR